MASQATSVAVSPWAVVWASSCQLPSVRESVRSQLLSKIYYYNWWHFRCAEPLISSLEQRTIVIEAQFWSRNTKDYCNIYVCLNKFLTFVCLFWPCRWAAAMNITLESARVVKYLCMYWHCACFAARNRLFACDRSYIEPYIETLWDSQAPRLEARRSPTPCMCIVGASARIVIYEMYAAGCYFRNWVAHQTVLVNCF